MINKLGGQEHFDEVLVEWNALKANEAMSDRWDRIIYYSIIDITIKYFCFRHKREADGFMRGLIVTHTISREEAAEAFHIGGYHYKWLREMDPNKPTISSESYPKYNKMSVD